MFVNSHNYEDCKKYYEKCWIKVAECGERVYRVDRVTSEFTDLSSPSRGENDQDADIRIDMKTGYTIAYVIPKKTTFQYGNQAVVLQRIPARMWRKGMDVKNTEFVGLGEKSTWTKIPLKLEIIEGFVNKPCYNTLEEALSGFETGGISAALTPRISISKDGSVFIDTVFVARYYANSKAIKVKKIFIPHISPLFENTKVIPV